MATSWYGNQCDDEGRNFGALAVIFPMLQRMEIANIINQHCPADPQAEFDHGTVLSVLAAARLYSPLALIHVAQWAEDSGANFLFGIPVEKLNDDRLARSLDAFFAQRHSILAHVALHVSRTFQVPLNELHYDPTHVRFAGRYAGAEPRDGVIGDPPAKGEAPATRSDGQLPPAHITKGRATDDAPPGTRMIHAGLCTHVDQFGPLPFFGHTVDGNQNGHTAVAEQFALLRKHLRTPELTFISDRGTFSVGHLARLLDAHCYALCAAPWDEFRSLFDQQRKQLNFKRASYLSIEQQRRRDTSSTLPQEHYDVAVLRHTLHDAESQRDIPCRVLFVFSSADQKVVRQQRQKQIDKIQQGLAAIQQSVAAGRRSTHPQAVAKRIAKLFGNKDAARYFSWEMVPLGAAERRELPPPARGCSRPTHRFQFHFDSKAQQHDEQYDGYSVLVTTVPQQQASADALFTKYKQQNYSEQVNREFKGPIAVHPVFLHTPQRVEALVFLLMITLTLYYLIQRLYRQSLPPKATPRQQRTTTQTILASFQSYILLIRHTRLGQEVRPTRLTKRQRELLGSLGFSTPAQILSQRLPRAPT
jgi:transposase